MAKSRETMAEQILRGVQTDMFHRPECMGPSHHVCIPPTKENEEESLYTTSLLASLWP